MSLLPRALNIIVMADDHAQVHGALSLAAAAAALGRPVRMFFQGVAVRALAEHRNWADDSALEAEGAPTISDLLTQCSELQVPVSACETGLHVTGIGAAGLRPGIETEGLIAFLAHQSDAELVTV